MVVADGQGLAWGSLIESASPSEVKLTMATLAEIRVPRAFQGRPRTYPKPLIVDRAYDSRSLRQQLAHHGVEMICPHRKGRLAPPEQDGRPLRRYRRRWKVERTIAWIGNFRRLLIRHERYPPIFHAFVRWASALIILSPF